MGKINFEESIKSEIAQEKLDAIKEALISGSKKNDIKIKENEEDNELTFSGEIGQLINICGSVTISPNKKNTGYVLEFDGKTNKTQLFWIYLGISTILFLIAFFVLWPLLIVSIIIDVVIWLNGPDGGAGKKKILKKFEEIVEYIKDDIK